MEFERNTVFVISYIFVCAAFLLQVPVYIFSIAKARKLKDIFLSFPIIYVGLSYLFVQAIGSLIIIIISKVSLNTAILINGAILLIGILFLLAVFFGRNKVSVVDDETENKTIFLKFLKDDVESISASAKDDLLKKELYELTDLVRYSDPISNNSLSELENEIKNLVRELKKSINSGNEKVYISKLSALLQERNRKTKLLKK
jgi:hypothetical protein